MRNKVWLEFAALLLSSPASSAPASNTCCSQKTVGEILYTLVEGDKESTTYKFGCKDGCVYTADQAGGYKFCFKEGPLPVTCLKFEWCYEGDCGPKYWGDFFPECNSTSQSPISQKQESTPLFFKNYDKIRGGMFGNTDEHYGESVKDSRLKHGNLTNNDGHTAELDVIETLPADVGVLSGGPLQGDYQMIQLHFHWGSDDTIGSEHTLDGKRFPMEMHIVNKKMGVSVPEALNMTGGLAVAGFFFEVDIHNNTAIEPLISALKNITQPNTFVDMSGSPFVITDLLAGAAPLAPEDIFTYSSYSCSLTIPACEEVVHWINFINQTIKISSYQLAMFRTLKNAKNQDLVNNFRPVQPLNGRIVSIYGA